MSIASLRTLAVLSLSAALYTACSSGDSSNGFGGYGTSDDGGSGGGYDAGHDSGSYGGYDSGSFQYDSGGGGSSGGFDSGTSSGSTEGGGGSCGSCKTDSDCQSSCPPVQGGGTNCCDVGSGVCYATTQNTCPVPSDGGTE